MMDVAKTINDLLDHCIAKDTCCIIIMKGNNDDLIQINSNMSEGDLYLALKAIIENTKKASKH